MPSILDLPAEQQAELLARIDRHVDRQGEHLIWTHTTRNGVPVLKFRGHRYAIRRVMLEHEIGERLNERNARTACDVPLCIACRRVISEEQAWCARWVRDHGGLNRLRDATGRWKPEHLGRLQADFAAWLRSRAPDDETSLERLRRRLRADTLPWQEMR